MNAPASLRVTSTTLDPSNAKMSTARAVDVCNAGHQVCGLARKDQPGPSSLSSVGTSSCRRSCCRPSCGSPVVSSAWLLASRARRRRFSVGVGNRSIQIAGIAIKRDRGTIAADLRLMGIVVTRRGAQTVNAINVVVELPPLRSSYKISAHQFRVECIQIASVAGKGHKRPSILMLGAQV